MKKGIVIINTARGAVIDEAALVKALEDGTVYSAGLDVYENEPTIHEGLLNNNKVILLVVFCKFLSFAAFPFSFSGAGA